MEEVLDRLKAMEGWGARLENLEEQGEHLTELLQEVLKTLHEQPARCVLSLRLCPAAAVSLSLASAPTATAR